MLCMPCRDHPSTGCCPECVDVKYAGGDPTSRPACLCPSTAHAVWAGVHWTLDQRYMHYVATHITCTCNCCMGVGVPVHKLVQRYFLQAYSRFNDVNSSPQPIFLWRSLSDPIRDPFRGPLQQFPTQTVSVSLHVAPHACDTLHQPSSGQDAGTVTPELRNNNGGTRRSERTTPCAGYCTLLR